LVYLLHPIILRIWSGRTLADFTLAGLMALIAILNGWGNTQSILLNSLGFVKWQAIASVIMTPIFIFLPFYMGKLWGVTGVASGTLICMIPGTFIWPIYARYALKAKLQETAVNAFLAVGCRDYARVDFRMDKKGKLYILEVNPNPDISLNAGYARALGAAGIEYRIFWQRMIEKALARKVKK